MNDFLSEQKGINFYTDGSGIDGHIGGAAVCPSFGAVGRRYMGTIPGYKVYSGELVGIILAQN